VTLPRTKLGARSHEPLVAWIHRCPPWIGAALLVGACLLLSACSSDDDSGGGGATTTPTGSGAAGAGGSTSTGGGGSGGSGGSGGEGGGTSLEEPGLIDDYPLYDPPASAIHIDPTNASDPQEDGSLDHPFDSFEDVTWTDGAIVVVRRGTTLDTDVVEIRASNVTLASYGGDADARPVIHCTAVASSGNNRHAIYATDRTDITIRDLEIHAPTPPAACASAGPAAPATR
jgi:hypothetical protein